VTYLLDTNVCIALINGNPQRVRNRLRRAASDGGAFAVPSVVTFELWYEVAKSARPEANRTRVETFFAGPIEILPFEDEDAQLAGEIRAALEKSGKPIGAYDVLIAGQALQRGATLVTANVTEVARVAGLVWENWAE
jgi:tRNA(fMet)-specific endonuclease VapC